MEPWVWALLVSVGLAVVGAFWALTRRGLERMDETLKEHGERISSLETDNDSNKIELGRLRDMRHDIIEQVSHSLASWYTDILKTIDKWKQQ